MAPCGLLINSSIYNSYFITLTYEVYRIVDEHNGRGQKQFSFDTVHPCIGLHGLMGLLKTNDLKIDLKDSELYFC